MYKSLLAIMCLILLSLSPAKAQQVLSNGGGSFENGGTTMTFTVGETVISTFFQPNGPSLTQGFNQAQLAPELKVLDESGGLSSGAELLFATVEPGGSSTLVLRVRNAGNGPFSITALNFIGGPVFSIEESINFPLVLPASNEQTLTLRFSPDQADDYMGQLRIVHTDAGATQPFILNLSASAMIADLPLMPWWASLLMSLSVIGLAVCSIRIL